MVVVVIVLWWAWLRCGGDGCMVVVVVVASWWAWLQCRTSVLVVVASWWAWLWHGCGGGGCIIIIVVIALWWWWWWWLRLIRCVAWTWFGLHMTN